MKWWGVIGLGLLCSTIPFVIAAIAGILTKGVKECYQKRGITSADWLYLFVGSILVWSAWQ